MTNRQTLLAKEGLCLVLALAALVAGAAFWPLAPVVDQPGAAAKAPWIFTGLQQLLRLGDPLWAGLVLPAACLAWLAALPRLGRPWAVGVAWAMVLSWAALTLWGYFF